MEYCEGFGEGVQGCRGEWVSERGEEEAGAGEGKEGRIDKGSAEEQTSPQAGL